MTVLRAGSATDVGRVRNTNQDRLINEPSGISQIQVVDGGIYYATDDHHLHFLRGGAPNNPR